MLENILRLVVSSLPEQVLTSFAKGSSDVAGILESAMWRLRAAQGCHG
jgi:hypothetical protein